MFRLNCCKAGSILLKLFLLFTGFFSALYLYDLFSAPFGFSGWADNRALFIIRAVAVILFCSALFWTGILLVYICCNQLRVKTRVLGLLFAWVPLLNLGMLLYIIGTADREYRFEKAKYRLNCARQGQQICPDGLPAAAGARRLFP